MFIKILIILISALSVFDTNLFVYPSLSYSLLTGILISLLAIITMIKHYRKTVTPNPIITGCAVAWMTYLVIYHILVPCETYRIRYIICSILYLVSLSVNLKNKKIDWVFIENIILCIAGLNIFCVILQIIGLCSSSNPLIKITGFNQNPSATAIYLVAAFAIMVNRLYEHKCQKLYLMGIFFSIFAILVLKCRTAYVGVVVIAMIYLSKLLKRRCTNYNKRYGIIIGCSILLFSLVFAFSLYQFKKGSSQGRLFIWKNSIHLITQQPSGYGYGLFEKTYNLEQSKYFFYGRGTSIEKRNADFVAMPYNDYLEMTIEGGLIGGLLYLSLFIISIVVAYRIRNTEVFSVLTAFIVMSMFNFVYSSVGVWLVLMSFIAMLSSNFDMITKSKNNFRYQLYARSILMMLGIVGFLLGSRVYKTTHAQLELSSIHQLLKNNITIYDDHILSLQKDIGTSEAYYSDLGVYFMLEGKNNDAVSALLQAKKYTSSPKIYYNLWRVYMGNRKYNLAVKNLKVIEYMQPIHLMPKYYIFQSYITSGNSAMAQQYAMRILNTKIKIRSSLSDKIKQEAKKYLLIHG